MITITPSSDSEFVFISYQQSDERGSFAHHCIARADNPEQQAEKLARLERLYFDKPSATPDDAEG